MCYNGDVGFLLYWETEVKCCMSVPSCLMQGATVNPDLTSVHRILSTNRSHIFGFGSLGPAHLQAAFVISILSTVFVLLIQSGS